VRYSRRISFPTRKCLKRSFGVRHKTHPPSESELFRFVPRRRGNLLSSETCAAHLQEAAGLRVPPTCARESGHRHPARGPYSPARRRDTLSDVVRDVLVFAPTHRDGCCRERHPGLRHHLFPVLMSAPPPGGWAAALVAASLSRRRAVRINRPFVLT